MRSLLALPLIVALIGCAVPPGSTGIAADIGVQYALMRYIDKADDPVLRAHAVLRIADALDESPGYAPLPELRQSVMTRVEGFDPADKFLAASVTDLLLVYLEATVPRPEVVDLSHVSILLRRAAGYYL